jgi:redox-sensitive bicupin YhaK (pirin superfamily)
MQTQISPTRSIRSQAIMKQNQMNQYLSIHSPRNTIADNLDPFLTFDEFHMSRPVFPPHPQAGFSVFTYVFEDSQGAIINRDSYSDHSRIAPSGLHWIQAGRGAQHEENPERPYQDTHGLQFWVNHSSAA